MPALPMPISFTSLAVKGVPTYPVRDGPLAELHLYGGNAAALVQEICAHCRKESRAISNAHPHACSD